MKKLNSLNKKELIKKSISAGIIALVLLISIFTNAIITLLGSKYGWYADMTKEGLHSISEELVDVLDGANMEVPIEIIFSCSKDYAEKNFNSLATGDALAYVHNTATQIADRYENVGVSYHDPQKEPEFYKENFLEIERFIANIENPVIIARKGTDGKFGTHFKVYAARAFYGFASSSGELYSYSGEVVFASALLALSYEKAPTVYFTTGHSETIASKQDKEAPSQLWSLFLSCGFDVKELDLSKSDASVPDNAALVVINEPQFDFSDGEIARLETYITNKGNVMIFTNPTYNDEIIGLRDFLEARCGIKISDGIVTDESTNLATDKNSFKAEIAGTSASSAYLSYLSNASSARPFFTNASYIKILNGYEDGINEDDGTIKTQAIYQTSANGMYNGEDDNYAVLTVTAITEIKDGEDGQMPYQEYAYVMVCPSSGFASDEALSTAHYPNKDIILSIAHATTATQTTANIDHEIFENYDLDITENQAKAATVCLATIIPVIIVAWGFVVTYRRRHR